MPYGNIHGQKSGVQSVDNVFPEADGNVALNALKTTGGTMTGNLDMGKNALSNVKPAVKGTDGANLDDAKKAAKGVVKNAFISKTVVLTTGAWDRYNKQTVECIGITATNDVIVAPHPDSYDAYFDSNVRMIEQSKDKATFQYNGDKPSELKVNLLVRKELA